MTDQELLELINDHDEAALASLEARFRDECIGEAMEITGDQRAARECFFDALISFWSVRAQGDNAVSNVGEIGESLKSSVRARARSRMGLAPASEASSTAPPVSAGDMSDPGAEDSSEEIRENTAKTNAATGAANDSDIPEENKTAADTKKRKRIKRLIILTAFLAMTGVIVALIIGIGSRGKKWPWNIDPEDPGKTGSSNASPAPFDDGLLIGQINVKIPETLEKLMVTKYARSVIPDPDETDLMLNEANGAVIFVNENYCGDKLVLNNYDFKAGEETDFRLRVKINLPVYDFTATSSIGDYVSLNVNVEYYGKAVPGYGDGGEKLLSCKVNGLNADPFESTQELFELNPQLTKMIQKLFLDRGIEKVNEDISNYLNEQELYKKYCFSMIPHIHTVVFEYSGGKRNVRVKRLHLHTSYTEYDLEYEYSMGEVSCFSVYTNPPVIYKSSAKSSSSKNDYAYDSILPWDEGSPNENWFVTVPPSEGASVFCIFKSGRLSEIDLSIGNGDELFETDKVISVKYKDDTGSNSCQRTVHYNSAETIRTVNSSGTMLRSDRYENGVKLHSELFTPYEYSSVSYSGLSYLTYFDRSEKGGIYETVFRCSGNNMNARVMDHMFEYDETTGEGKCEYYDAAGNVIASFPATFDGIVWLISSKENWEDQDFYFGTVDPSPSDYVFEKLSMFINQNARFVNMRPDQITISSDGRFSLYLIVAVNLPVSLLSSSTRSVNIQVRITGRAAKNEAYTARPVWALDPEQAEYVGLYGTSYGVLYDAYQTKDNSSFIDQAGKELAGAADYFDFVDIMVNYLAEVVNTGEIDTGDGQWLYALGFYTDAMPIDAYLNVNLPPVDDASPIDDDFDVIIID